MTIEISPRQKESAWEISDDGEKSTVVKSPLSREWTVVTVEIGWKEMENSDSHQSWFETKDGARQFALEYHGVIENGNYEKLPDQFPDQ
jgi:hypothetical protein